MNRLRVLQLNTGDCRGGAANIAWNLFQAYRTRGYGSWLAVNSKTRDDSDILVIPNNALRSSWARAWLAIGKLRTGSRFEKWSVWMGQPIRQLRVQQGHEDFDFPGCWRLLELPPERPDILHCHNLHGNYFDLRALSWLSQQLPVVTTLHDEWLLTGHCAYTPGCERWKIGCGDCPDLQIYPSVERDATAFNRQRKEAIYAHSQLHVSTPCRWLMDKVAQSILAPAVASARIMPYGVDLSVFHPDHKRSARLALGIPNDVSVLLFTANGIRQNMFKDYGTIEAAVARASDHLNGQELRLVALGEDALPERIGRCHVQFVGYEKDQRQVARYYQAADVYVHAAKADTFPAAILEALACGTPVIATNVGGVSEQIKGCANLTGGLPPINCYKSDEATGVLVDPADAESMAVAIIHLLSDYRLRRQLGNNAARDGRIRFDLRRYADEHLEWYHSLVTDYVERRWNGNRLAGNLLNSQKDFNQRASASNL